MAKQVLDLYELFNLVTARGGLVEVINKKQWQEIIKGLNLPSSITSAAFTLRTQWVWKVFLNQHIFFGKIADNDVLIRALSDVLQLFWYGTSLGFPEKIFNSLALQAHNYIIVREKKLEHYLLKDMETYVRRPNVISIMISHINYDGFKHVCMQSELLSFICPPINLWFSVEI